MSYLTFSVAGEVVKHGDLRCVRNEGMPIYKAPLEKGMLVIQFLVSALFSSRGCCLGTRRDKSHHSVPSYR